MNAGRASAPPDRRLITYSETVTLPAARLVIDHAPRCWRCHRPLFEKAARPWAKRCDECKAPNASPPGGP